MVVLPSPLTSMTLTTDKARRHNHTNRHPIAATVAHCHKGFSVMGWQLFILRYIGHMSKSKLEFYCRGMVNVLKDA